MLYFLSYETLSSGFEVLSRRFSYIVLLRLCYGFPTVLQKDTCVNIFVGNLAFSTTDHDLRQLFEPYGAVNEIRVITDRDTGRSKGFGFVEMPDGTAATSAIQGANGKELAGRALTVNEARPREPRREPRQDRW